MSTFKNLTFLLALAGLLVSCGGDDSQTGKSKSFAQSQNKTTQLNKTSQMVYFRAKDLDGIYHSSDEWIGKKPVVINFWGTWCPPCRKELPDLIRLYDEYNSRGVEIIGLAVNDQPGKVRDFSRQMGMKWVMLMGDREIAGMFGIRGVPMTIFFNSEGQIVQEFHGMRDYEAFKVGFEAIL